jgi:hypothetical protein
LVVTCECNGTSDSTLVPLNDRQGERHAGGLGRGQRLLGQGERAALHDGPLEEPVGAGRDHLGQHR